MDNGQYAIALCLTLAMWVLLEKRMSKMQREIDLIVKGDLETLKLKRKLDGYPEDD